MSKETLDAVRHLIEEEGLSQRIIAREAGISGTTLNQLLSGKYQGDEGSMMKKLVKYLSSRDLAVEMGKKAGDFSEFVETPTARRIQAVLNYVSTLSDMAVIYGGSGVGKTRALKKYSEMHPNCWIVTVSPPLASMAACLEEIALTLGLRGFSGRASRLQREIIRRLMDTKGVLIIDEAQHLFLNGLEAIRAIHDATEIGLILAGNESVFSRLSAGGARTAAFSQLSSRIGKRLCLSTSRPGDGSALARAFGVDGEREIEFIEEIAKSPGALRGVVKTIRLASVMAHENGGQINLKYIKLAWRDLAGLN
jgi:DNA transposition AAA+ family ATPase